ncbi:MAG: ABC transporter ATP-binding protein [Acidobacteria bacterium]|nr:ABC transporter ATP-binding protein [Acidobacteriota bacterium]
MAERIAIEAGGVWKRYGTRDVLRGIDLAVTPGELRGLLGPNGAGKTTLLRVLLGLVRCDRGRVTILGSERRATGALPEGVAGFVDSPAFYPYLSARANLALLGRLDGAPRRARDARVDAALDAAGLLSDATVAVAAYSAGMRLRLGLAAALLRSPRVLLLDEPTGALDPAAARDIRAIVTRLARDGAAVLWSSHDMAEVEDLCSTISVIDDGELIFSGTVDELRTLAPRDVHTLRTSDDAASLAIARAHRDVHVEAGGGALRVMAEEEALDALVIALGRAGIAVRLLERRARSLESLFLELTNRDAAVAADDAASTTRSAVAAVMS